MAGQFLSRCAIVDTLASERAANAVRRRRGLSRHPITATVCGCPDPCCGAFHTIREDRSIPTAEEADATLHAEKARRRAASRAMKAHMRRHAGTYD